MKSFGITDKGKVRKDNQDSFVLELCPISSKDCIVASICDGMGGAQAGALASQLANKAFAEYLYDKLVSYGGQKTDYEKVLKTAVKTANRAVFNFSQLGEEYKGMGTTLVGGFVDLKGVCHIVNVGDSRAYMVSRHGEVIRQMTRDHSYVQELVASGVISREEAKDHPRRNIITRALGAAVCAEADYYRFELKSDDCLLLCSDGLYNMMTDDEIAKSVKVNKVPEMICNDLLETALIRGAKDNVTIVIVKK